jgi:hypothetical protein
VKRALVIAALAALCSSASLARPQKDHRSWFRVVGRVLDTNGRPIRWGRVYVKDTHAHFLRIKPVDRDGHFNSALLNTRLDYEVYAEQDEVSSEKVLIAGPEKTSEIVITLTLSRKHETH